LRRAGVLVLPMQTPDGTYQDKIEVVIDYVRVEPFASSYGQSERIEYPNPKPLAVQAPRR
jgi:hypothetical protein